MNGIDLEERLRSGDELAYAEVIDLYSPLVASIISNLGGGALTAEDIEEAASDTFITLWKNKGQIHNGKLRGYICAIAKSRAWDKLRSNPPDSDDIEELSVEAGERTEVELERRELAEQLRKALEGLEMPDREIIIRRYYYYQKPAEISEIMGIKLNTVKTKLQRGREKLKRILEEGGFSL